MIAAAFVTFFAFWILTRHLKPRTMRRIVGHKGKVDLCLHLGVILLFHGTFSGLMQAECAAIFMSLYLLSYRKLYGYEKRVNGAWVRFAGKLPPLPDPAEA
jgi:succinate-acetate transporter protein